MLLRGRRRARGRRRRPCCRLQRGGTAWAAAGQAGARAFTPGSQRAACLLQRARRPRARASCFYPSALPAARAPPPASGSPRAPRASLPAALLLGAGSGIFDIGGTAASFVGEVVAPAAVVVSASAKQLRVAGLSALALAPAGVAHALGGRVRSSGFLLSPPTSPRFLGAVQNPLCVQPLRARGSAGGLRGRWLIETPAPALLLRRTVAEPLQSGLLVLDSLVPVGRGQRELVLGDRKSGKSAICLDTTLNQEGEGVVCVCASIGARAAAALAFFFVVAARSSSAYVLGLFASAFDCAALQYLSPYAAAAASELLMWEGQVPVFLAVDDLSKHAVCYRELCLLLMRPPGREAYPGEIFFVHSRLLERAAKLSLGRGGGSLTAFPVIETLAADVSAYISTNVISITDGQLFLSAELFLSNTRPAVELGLSVTRVGGAAQWLGARSLAGSPKIEMAQYFELQAFAQFSADLGEQTQRALGRGARLQRLLCQRAGAPLPLPAELALLALSLRADFGGRSSAEVEGRAGVLRLVPAWALCVAAGWRS